MTTEQTTILSFLNDAKISLTTQKVADECGLTPEKALSVLGALALHRKVIYVPWNDTPFWRITEAGQQELILEQQAFEDSEVTA